MTEEAKLIIGQALGVLATVITLLSYQTNSNRRLLVVQTAATLSNCLSYLFLQASSGFALNIVCILRNVIYYFQKPRTTANRISALLLAAAMTVLGAFSWQGPVSLLIIIALALNTLFMSLGSPQLLRKSILLTSTLILLYNIFVFSIGGMANEIVAIVSSIIGIIRFRTNAQKNRRFD
ncbi:MAG: YgjV family protein [Clostridia bacterium]|nr:YgjV family protein [Clostridia bacterium]